ncbi:MAG TPA: cupin-like domain-containing protein [Myxococcota bacterium]|nr:cupin-like domain-containing protein [Myxococcota bacterium]
MKGVPVELWRWAGELYANGLARKDVALRLVEAGLEPALADEVAHDVGVIAALSLGAQLRREVGPEHLVEVRAEGGHRGPRLHQGVEVFAETGPMSAERFWREHWELNRPLVLRGYADSWPARRWTLSGLAERFGDAPIEVEVDRDPTRHYEGRWVTTTLSAFLADLEGRPGNDRYCIARNKNLEKALAPLLDDIVVDTELFDASRLSGGSSLWIGPGGTITPLHYDTTHILFTQLVGRKRFGLVSPDWVGLMLRLDGFYVMGDLAAVPPGALHEVTLEPGDALFLPAGWFHRVVALDASVSFSLLCFRRPNDFSWCHPARLLRTLGR